jgi:CheY-like chemotaxis protein
VSILFPEAEQPVDQGILRSHADGDHRGSECLLVTEDDAAMRRLLSKMLGRAGYEVLLAADGDEALEIAGSKADAIDLLLTDLIMPGMSGKHLADEFRARHGHIRVLYMSGYADDALGERHLDDSVHFIQKPFGSFELRRKVRDLLDAPDGEGAA